jgi:rhamnose transport system permease protein
VLVVLTRNIDLSVSSMVGLTAYVVGTILTRVDGMHPLAAVTLSMAIGLALGRDQRLDRRLRQGSSHHRHPRHARTLQGRPRRVLGGKTVTTADLPDWLNDVPSATLVSAAGFDLRLMVGIAAGCVVLGQFALRYLPFGRRLYAIGSNPESGAHGRAAGTA